MLRPCFDVRSFIVACSTTIIQENFPANRIYIELPVSDFWNGTFDNHLPNDGAGLIEFFACIGFWTLFELTITSVASAYNSGLKAPAEMSPPDSSENWAVKRHTTRYSIPAFGWFRSRDKHSIGSVGDTQFASPKVWSVRSGRVSQPCWRNIVLFCCSEPEAAFIAVQRCTHQVHAVHWVFRAMITHKPVRPETVLLPGCAMFRNCHVEIRQATKKKVSTFSYQAVSGLRNSGGVCASNEAHRWFQEMSCLVLFAVCIMNHSNIFRQHGNRNTVLFSFHHATNSCRSQRCRHSISVA